MPLVTRQANQGKVFSQNSEPGDRQNGQIWIDTSTDSPSISTSNGTDYNNIQIKVGGVNIPGAALL